LCPDDGTAYYRLACLAAQQGNTGQALSMLQKAVFADKSLKEEILKEKLFAPYQDKPAFRRIWE